MKKKIWCLALMGIIASASSASAVTKEEEDAIYHIIMARRGQPTETTEVVKVSEQAELAPVQQADIVGSEKKKEAKRTDPDVEILVASATLQTAPPAAGMSAQEMSAKMADESFAAPSSGTRNASFYEASAYVGAYRSIDTGSHGTWWMLEGIKWLRGDKEKDPQNFGFGLTVKGEQGETGDGRYNWSSIAVGPNLDYWAELGLGEDYFLAKFRPLYRWKQDGSSGFMPGAYLELDHLMGQNDTVIAALDGQYFPGDSYASLSLLWDHRFNEDFKVKGGFNLTGNFGEGSVFGIGPTVSVRLYDRWILGASLNFLDNGGSMWGVYGGYELNTDMKEWYAQSGEDSVTLVTDETQKNKQVSESKNSITNQEGDVL
ncbi:MAG: hypothetical protein WC823_01100 [Parcubacteria group bacterium]|jgi:hypothetical protein